MTYGRNTREELTLTKRWTSWLNGFQSLPRRCADNNSTAVMKTPKKSDNDSMTKFWSAAAEVFPGSINEIRKLRNEYEAGRIPDAPRIWNRCQDWTQAWIYLIRQAHRADSLHLRFEADRVIGAVLVGNDFGEKFLDFAKRFCDRFGPHQDLRELRLIHTDSLNTRLDVLRRLFPAADFQLISEQQYEESLRAGVDYFWIGTESGRSTDGNDPKGTG
jgi:hypothetical protein